MSKPAKKSTFKDVKDKFARKRTHDKLIIDSSKKNSEEEQLLPQIPQGIKQRVMVWTREYESVSFWQKELKIGRSSI